MCRVRLWRPFAVHQARRHHQLCSRSVIAAWPHNALPCLPGHRQRRSSRLALSDSLVILGRRMSSRRFQLRDAAASQTEDSDIWLHTWQFMFYTRQFARERKHTDNEEPIAQRAPVVHKEIQQLPVPDLLQLAVTDNNSHLLLKNVWRY